MKTTTRIISAGLIPLLVLTVVPGCTARHMPDWDHWNDVLDLPEGKQVEVQVYKGKGSHKIKGYFLSATENSIAISEKPLKKGGSRSVYQEIQKEKIRKILAHRELSKRWSGWLALGIAFAVGAQSFRAEADYIASYQLMYGLALPIGISIPFFLGSKMGGVYKAPPEDRDRVEVSEKAP